MNTRKLQMTILTLLILAALIAIAAACSPFGSDPTPPPMGAADTTTFTNLAAADLTLSDDLTVADDATITDDLAVTGLATVGETLAVTGASTFTGAAAFTGAMTGPAIGVENLRLPTIETATIITSTDGALWTVGASEIWWIDRVFCNVTTNFDCTGDDCTIEIGLTGGDIDGFLDLDDAELQAADAEIAGLTAGWQGFGSTDTRGAFFAAGGGVILGNDTIDIKIEDNSASTDPTAGAATCYIVYTRLQ